MQVLSNNLAELSQAFPIGAQWGQPDQYAFQVEIEGLHLHLLGLCSTKSGEQPMSVTASAASTTESPFNRAWFELLERLAIVEFLGHPSEKVSVFTLDGKTNSLDWAAVMEPALPAPLRYAKSNGVAAHSDRKSACANAYYELVERDQLLRAWMGKQSFQAQQVGVESWKSLEPKYEFWRCQFSSDVSRAFVVGLFALPKDRSVPLACGFGAAASESIAQAKAEGEVLQRLGFLWGEQIPESVPENTGTAEFHQEWSLSPEGNLQIAQWLRQGGAFSGPVEALPSLSEMQFMEMTPAHLQGRLHVVKAFHPKLLPLVFGGMPTEIYGEVPKERLIHFIA